MHIKTQKNASVQTTIRFIVILLGFAVLSGCASWGPPTSLVEETGIKFMVEPDFEISLNTIPSELVIKGTDNDYAEASMEVRCPDISGSCAKHFAGLEFETRREGKNLTISANRGPLMGGNSAVKTTLALPRVEQLEVNMFAGEATITEIDVSRLDVDIWAGNLGIRVNKLDTLNVDLFAGDVNMEIPENSVAEFGLDAGVGDVSIRTPGGFKNAPRSFLVGAEVKKFISSEGVTVNADVQFGNIRLNLTP